MNWYSTGFQGAGEAAKKSEQSRKINRFWIKPGESKEMVFVDDACFVINEHNIKVNGKWGNTFTCLGEENGCPFCQTGSSKYIGFFTIVDLTGYINRDNQVQGKNQLMFLAAHAKVVETIDGLKAMRETKSLVGCKFKVTRSESKNSLGTGEKFDFIQAFNPEQLLQKYQPFNYQQLLAPMDRTAASSLAARLMGQVPNSGQQGYTPTPQAGGQMPSQDSTGMSAPNLNDIPF